jgi:hypothetical protein
LPGPRFFSLAYRIAVYPGVMQMRLRTQAAQERDPVVSGPREMSAAAWLAEHPQAVARIDRDRKG